MSVAIPFILDVRLVDVPAGVTQEKGHTGFLYLPSAVLALTFLARRIQPFLSLVNREVEFCVLTNEDIELGRGILGSSENSIRTRTTA